MCTLAYILSHCEVDNIFFGNVCYFSVKCTQQFLQCSSAHQITLEVTHFSVIYYSLFNYCLQISSFKT